MFYFINYIIILLFFLLKKKYINDVFEIVYIYDYLRNWEIGVVVILRCFFVYNYFNVYVLVIIIYRKYILVRMVKLIIEFFFVR